LKTEPSALQHRIFKRIFDMAKIGDMTQENYLEYYKGISKYYDLIGTELSNQELGKELGKELKDAEMV
jgi:hypothetical protein